MALGTGPVIRDSDGSLRLGGDENLPLEQAPKTGEESLADLLLRGPVFTKEQLARMKKTRKAFEQWRDR